MEKRQTILIVIAAAAVIVAICASVLGIAALSRAKALEQRIIALEQQVTVLEQRPLPSPDNTADLPAPTENTGSDRVSLTLGDWAWEDSVLVLRSGYARVQVEEDQLSEADLELCADGNVLQGCRLTMVSGEATGTMEADLADITFPVAESELSGVIELRLTARLTSGETLTAVVGGWSYEGGKLMLISG